MTDQNKDALTIHNLTLDYGERRVVYDANLALKPQ